MRVALAVLLAALLTAAVAWLAQPAGARLVQVKCFRCHQRPSVVYGPRKDREGWDRTVRRMEDHGLELTAEEREEIVVHLAEERGEG